MKCEICEGKRVVFGFGGMKHKCTACSGTGSLNLTAKTHNVDNREINSSYISDETKKKFRSDKKEV